MKISKDAVRASRLLLRACFDASGRLHTSRVKRVVKLVGEKKPRNYMAILHSFQRLVRLELEKRTAVIESVTDLSGEMRERLRVDLQKKYGEDLTLNYFINPSLIGGMRVKVGSHVWDGSVQAKLQALGESLA
ncbi:MAG: F0F1 ATP synthase subunit delta [Verrucomicrobia bacterium]|nr:F0F1 ATP synthase subunit delta [Verrucomicrobiota bacterium]